jgi:hypothetical protein
VSVIKIYIIMMKVHGRKSSCSAREITSASDEFLKRCIWRLIWN